MSSAFCLQPAGYRKPDVASKELGQPQAAVHTLLIHHLFVSAGIHSVQSVLLSKEEGIDMQLAQQAGFDSN